MNDPIIVTTPAQLREIVADEVAAILPKLADRAGHTHHPGHALQSSIQKHDSVQEIRTPHGVLEKGAFNVDRGAHCPFGGQADRCRIAYCREC